MERALQALADPTRRRILDLLAQGEMAAGEIAGHFPSISRPAVSQHLAVLREAGLVRERREGRRRIYRLEPEPLREIWEGWLSRYQRFWGRPPGRPEAAGGVRRGQWGGTGGRWRFGHHD